MNTAKTFHWARLLKSVVALTLVLAMLLCGCATLPGGEGDGDKNNKPNGQLPGDGKLEPQDAVDGVSALYGMVLDILSGNMELDASLDMAMQNEVVVTLGDEIKAQLGGALEQIGMSEDVSWFQSIGFSSTTVTKGDMLQMILEAKLNGESLVSGNVIMDQANGMIYAALPGLNDETIGVNIGAMMPQPPTVSGGMAGVGSMGGVAMVPGTADMIAQMEEMLAQHKDLIKALPTEEEMNALLTSYLETALDCLDKGTAKAETLTYGGVSQNVTATTFVYTRHDVLDTAIALLTKTKTDKDLEKALDAFGALGNAIAKQQDPEAEQVDMYEMLMGEVDSMIEDLEEAKAATEDLEFLRLVSYTANDQTVGFQVYLPDMGGAVRPEGKPEYPEPTYAPEVDDIYPAYTTAPVEEPTYPEPYPEEYYAPVTVGEEAALPVLTVYSLENNGKTALYLDVMGKLEFSGTGTVKSGKASGNYVLKMDGAEFLKIELKDFTANVLSSETLEGTIRLRMGQALANQVQANPIINENTVIELKLQIDEQNMDLTVNLYSGDMFIAGIATKNKILKNADIKVPTEYTEIADEEAMMTWVSKMDFEALLENLEEAGIPNEMIQMLEQMMQGGFGGEPEYDYEYDY